MSFTVSNTGAGENFSADLARASRNSIKCSCKIRSSYTSSA